MLLVLLLSAAVAHGCTDSVPSCPMLKTQCAVSVVSSRCQFTCNTCVTPSPTPGASQTPSPVPGSVTPPVVCKDVSATSCAALAANPANYCKTNPLVPKKCPVSCKVCKPTTPSPVIACPIAPTCAAPCTLSDTDGDGCDDKCICPCAALTCSGVLAPFDTTGDGCSDTCASNCPNHASKKTCNKDKANRCKYDKKSNSCQAKPCSSGSKSKGKCNKLAGCAYAAGVCYDQGAAPPAPVTPTCDIYTSKQKCNRDTSCKWSSKKGGACNTVAVGPAICASNNRKKQCDADTTCQWSNNACIDAGGVAPGPAIDCSVFNKGQCNSEPLCVYDKKRASGDRCYDPVCALADVQAVYLTIKRSDPLAYQACVDFFENGMPGVCPCLRGLQPADTRGLKCLARIGETEEIASATTTCHSGTAACLGPKNVLDCATMSASQFGPCIWNGSTCDIHDGTLSACSTTDFLLDSTSVLQSTSASQQACGNVAAGSAGKTDMCDCMDSFDSSTAAKYAWCTMPGSTKLTAFEEFGKCL